MASALQKLFRKRLSKQQQQGASASKRDSIKDAVQPTKGGVGRPRKEPEIQAAPHPYYTVSSLNSPSPSVSTNHSRYSTSSTGFFAPVSQSHVDLADTAGNSSAERRARSASVDGITALNDSVCTARRRWNAPLMPDASASVQVDQFGNYLPSPGEGKATPDNGANAVKSTSSQQSSDDEDDISKNVLFSALWQRADIDHIVRQSKLIFVPSAEALQTIGDHQVLQSSAYLALHACIPSELFKDRYVSVSRQPLRATSSSDSAGALSLTATLQPERRSVLIVLTRPAEPRVRPLRYEQTLRVESETTVFQTVATSRAGKKERIRVRVLVLRGMVIQPSLFHRGLSPGPPTAHAAVPATTGIAPHPDVELPSSISFPPKDALGTPTASPSRAPMLAREDSASKSDNIPITRRFLADLAFILDPGDDFIDLRPAMLASLDTLRRAASNFTTAYVYVPGFDTYNVSRIRRGILAKAWQSFEQVRQASGVVSSVDLSRLFGHQGKARLLLLLENVVMGYCHGKVYSSIASTMREADDAFDSILATYHDSRVSLEDFDISAVTSRSKSSQLTLAEKRLLLLGDPDEDLEDVVQEPNIQQIKAIALPLPFDCSERQDAFMDRDEKSPKGRDRSIRTPLDALDVMWHTLNAISQPGLNPGGSSGLQTKSANMLSTDDLLPLLAYVLVKTAPRKLVSLLYYTRLFGISDATSGEHNWALTTFDSTIKYLRSDPLKLCRDFSPYGMAPTPGTMSVRSIASSVRSLSPQTSPPLVREATASSSSQTQGLRSRYASLPSAAILATSVEDPRASFDSLNSQDKVSSAHDHHCNHDVVARHASFKIPGMPASATTAPRLGMREGSISPEKEDGTMTRSLSSSSHTRVTSMTSDIKIRPQIVVRNAGGRRSTVLARSGTFNRTRSDEDAFSSSNLSSPERPLGGTSMAHSAAPPEPPREVYETRRKSLDSWSTMNLFNALSLASSTDAPIAQARRASAVEGDVETSKNTTAQQVPRVKTEMTRSSTFATSPASPASASGSGSGSGWLSIWSGDRGRSTKRVSSHVAPERCASVEGASRASSVASHERASFSPATLPRTSSNRSLVDMGMGTPSIDSVPSLENLDMSSEIDADASHQSAGGQHSLPFPNHSEEHRRRTSLEKQPMLSSSRAKQMSWDKDSATLRANVARSTEKRRRVRTRTRLLSITNPDNLTTTQWTAEAAGALATPTNAERHLSDVDMGRSTNATPRQSWLHRVAETHSPGKGRASSASVDGHQFSSKPANDENVPLQAPLRSTSPQKSIRGAPHVEATSPARATRMTLPPFSRDPLPQAPFVCLHTPTPVEELPDPINVGAKLR